MLFSSVSFIYAFLPVTLLCYFLAPSKARNGVLLFFSLLFYFWGEPKYTALLIISSLSDYLHSLYIEAHRGERSAKRALISSIVVNLLLLGVYKYADFLIGAVNSLTGAGIPALGLKLPIGISFFTFQTMSYTIDVYRGDVRAQRNLATLATYVCLFPQLVAGPIVRYISVAKELEARRHTYSAAAQGMRQFVCGLAKKVLLANTLGELSGLLLGGAAISVTGLWLGTAAFMVQVYFDFSGYSDMAIGLGRIFGFYFPGNFDYPFISKSLAEFWRRWHMTLGGWFRDYVYIPMGGNRVTPKRWIFNVAVVWALTGLWHGAAWNFVLWGLFFAIMLPIEKLVLGKALMRLPGALRHVYALFFLTISFAIFNDDTPLGYASVLYGMFGGLTIPIITYETLYYMKSYAVVLILCVLGSTPLVKRAYERVSRRFGALMSGAEPVAILMLLLASTAYLVDGSFNPFLYFRF